MNDFDPDYLGCIRLISVFCCQTDRFSDLYDFAQQSLSIDLDFNGIVEGGSDVFRFENDSTVRNDLQLNRLEAAFFASNFAARPY
jgi:hypothetical protein